MESKTKACAYATPPLSDGSSGIESWTLAEPLASVVVNRGVKTPLS